MTEMYFIRHGQSLGNLAGRFLYHSIADTMQENGAGNAGVNFEKYLIELIMEGTNYNRESSCTQ